MTPGVQQLPEILAAARKPSRPTIRNAIAWAIASGGVLSCGARSSLLDFSSAGGPTTSSESGSGATSTCGDTQSDRANCGGCGVACTGTCMTGRCLVTLASAQMNVGCIAVDASNVYWATADLSVQGAINKISLDGGPFSTIGTTPSAPWPCTMAVDSMFVYWADGSNGSVMKVRTRGSVAVPLAAAAGADYIAVDRANVYWTGQFGYPTKVSLDGGPTTRLADSYSADGVAIDAASLYWTARGAGNTGGTVLKVPLGGGAPVTLASNQGFPEGIAADGANVYWANYQGGTIQKISRNGGAISTLASGQFNPSVIAVDEASVYWSTSTGSLLKVSKTGGATTTLAYSPAFDIAVDATSVYWTDGSSVLKLTPK